MDFVQDFLLKLGPKVRINNIPALVPIGSWMTSDLWVDQQHYVEPLECYVKFYNTRAKDTIYYGLHLVMELSWSFCWTWMN